MGRFDLKPCPFCGGKPEMIALPSQYAVACKCGARMFAVNQTSSEIADRKARRRCADKWNARAGRWDE